MKMGTPPSIGKTRNYWYNYQTQCNNFVEMRPGYNPDGDKLMSSVILNATFDNTENLA